MAYQSGVVPMTGTLDKEHMLQNVGIFELFELSETEMQMLGQSGLNLHDEF